jgi:hypothetical protein
VITVGILENPFNPDALERREVEDLRAFLVERFEFWPDTARIYDLEGLDAWDRALDVLGTQLLTSRDVTPKTEEAVERLGTLPGPFLVVVSPANPLTAIIIAVVVVIVALAAVVLLLPKPPSANDVYQSPNNSLSDRTNKPRPMARIPDIFGTVRSVPDLIAVPYRMFVNNTEVEIAYMCVGRGTYELSDVCDGDTPLSSIAGSSAAFYGPSTSPTSGGPQLQIGGAITEPVVSVQRMNDINGQTLKPSNSNYVNGDNNIRFTAPDSIETTHVDGSDDIDFTDYFEADDSLTVTGTGGLFDPTDYNGTYTILSVTASTIVLSDPASVNSNWSDLVGSTDYISPSLSTSGLRWIGPFVASLADLDRLLSNFVASAGLYQVSNKGHQTAVTVGIELEMTPVDGDDNPIGAPELFETSLTGDADQKDSVGVTLIASPTFVGRASIRARRTTPTDHSYNGTLVDEVKWRDSYAMSVVTAHDFGDVTTVQTRTYATAGATSLKERKFNLNARRCLPRRTGSVFSAALYGTDSVDDIVSAVALDPYIGGRSLSEVDFQNVYSTVAAVKAYFGSPLAAEFGFTFDDDSVSFEETLATIAAASFCVAYRQGSVLRLSFERATPASVLLFNHRNTVPASQQRSVNFGVLDDHDGIELDWIDPDDGAPLTYDIPPDSSALSPSKLEVQGVRSELLAFWHAWRSWNKMRYQYVTLEQECTQEAALVIPTDRVRATDQTRPPGFEGEVIAQDGLNLVLSQPVLFEDGLTYTIFLQHIDATVEALSVFPWSAPLGWEPQPGQKPLEYRVTLGTIPRLPLAVDADLSVRAGYEIVDSVDTVSRAYLVTEREPNSNFTETLRAINYSFLYYQADQLLLWMSFGETAYDDTTPHNHNGVAAGGLHLADDETRDRAVAEGTSPTAVLALDGVTAPATYTKAFWALYGSSDLDGQVLSSVDGASELVHFFRRDIVVSHVGGVAVVTPRRTDGLWHHYVITYDGTLGRVYIDGVLAATGALGGRGLGPLQAIGVGAGQGLVGRLDELRLWTRALLPDEVVEVWRSTRINV